MELELFSSFRIPYELYVDLELVFALKLHISPDVLEKMYFYDIMLLYHRYEDYVKEENESQKQQQEEYEEQQADMRAEMSSIQNNMNNFGKNFSVPSIGGFNPGSFNI